MRGLAGLPTLRGMDEVRTGHPPAHTIIVVQPNASLSIRQAIWFMASISTVSLGVALYLTWLGFWPVLPFAGIELVALALALWVSMRDNAYREVIRVEGDRVQLEFGMVGEGARSRVDLPRAMVRVRGERGLAGDLHLMLLCGEQRFELGRCLGPQDRASLVERLREVFRPGWQNTAALPAAGAASLDSGD